MAASCDRSEEMKLIRSKTKGPSSAKKPAKLWPSSLIKTLVKKITKKRKKSRLVKRRLVARRTRKLKKPKQSRRARSGGKKLVRSISILRLALLPSLFSA